jgi:hypothetical protein
VIGIRPKLLAKLLGWQVAEDGFQLSVQTLGPQASAAATSARPPIAPAAGGDNLSSQPFSPAALRSLNFLKPMKIFDQQEAACTLPLMVSCS